MVLDTPVSGEVPIPEACRGFGEGTSGLVPDVAQLAQATIVVAMDTNEIQQEDNPANGGGETVHKRNIRLWHEWMAAREKVELLELTGGSRAEKRRAASKAERIMANALHLNRGLYQDYAKRFKRDQSSEIVKEAAAAGTVELVHAWNTWCPTKGTLGGWAMRFIKSATRETIRTSENHLHSRSAFEARGSVLAAEQAIRNRRVEPTPELISEISGVSVSKVKLLMEAERNGKMAYLDAASGDSEGSSLRDTLMDQGPVLDTFMLREIAAEELETGDLWLFLRYHGVDGAPPETYLNLGAARTESKESPRRRIQTANRLVEAAALRRGLLIQLETQTA